MKKSTLQPIFPLQYMTIAVSVWQQYIFFLFLMLTLLPPKKYQRGCNDSLNSSVSKLPPYIFSPGNASGELVIRDLGEICYCSIPFFKN